MPHKPDALCQARQSTACVASASVKSRVESLASEALLPTLSHRGRQRRAKLEAGKFVRGHAADAGQDAGQSQQAGGHHVCVWKGGQGPAMGLRS